MIKSKSRNCINNPDHFCYICGEYILKENQRKVITEAIKKSYLDYFGIDLKYKDKSWTPSKACKTCVEHLRQWSNGKRSCLKFETPMIWKEQRDHLNDCYFCIVKIRGLNRKNRHTWSYPNLDSAVRPKPLQKGLVPHHVSNIEQSYDTDDEFSDEVAKVNPGTLSE